MSERAVYGTRKHRAEDLEPGDVSRNRYGKWARVTGVNRGDEKHYVDVLFDAGGVLTLRDVHLVDVQVVKPS